MDTILKFKKRLPALYRWSRRRRYFPHAVMLLCGILFLPIGIVGGAKLSQSISTNKALAATRAIAPEHSVMDVLSEGERKHYAATLSSLVIDDPETMDRLIGHDFLVMFNEPALQRAEGDYRIWQYRTASCVMDIYFDAETQAVAHYEVRQRKMAAFGSEGEHHEGTIDARDCLREIYKQRGAQNT